MRSWFGEPGSVEKSSLPGCVEQWYYHYSITDDWKQGTVSKTFTAFFDEKGLLCAANYSCTGRCVGADMVAGGEEAKGEVSIFDPLLRPSRKFDTSRIRDLALRKQGRAEVSALFGEPLEKKPWRPTSEILGQEQVTPKCIEIWTYTYWQVDTSHASNAAAGMQHGLTAGKVQLEKDKMPKGGSKNINQVLDVRFDNDGKLCSWSFIDTETPPPEIDAAVAARVKDDVKLGQEQVRALLGPPQGAALSDKQGCGVETWSYRGKDSFVVVLFDSAGKVCK